MNNVHKQVLYGLDLNVGMFKGGADTLTIDGIRRGLRADLAYIERKAKRNNWHFIVGAVLSQSSVKGDAARPHAHLVVFGSPACTVTQALKAYWTKYWSTRGYEVIPALDYLKKQTTDGRLSYMWKQRQGRFFVRPINYTAEHAAVLFQCEPEDAVYFLRREGLTRNFLLALLGYTCDDEEISVTDYPMIKEKTRPCDASYIAYLKASVSDE